MLLQKYRRQYILRIMKDAKAKLFQNGGSQAVRLPKDCRFPEGESEVLVRRDGQRVILESLDVWPTSFGRALGAWREEIERPAQTKVADLRDAIP